MQHRSSRPPHFAQDVPGGIYDQLGGGFARYSVDERWLVPHFEKMLYDNAQLLELLSLAWHETGEEIFEGAVRETVAWLRREMRTERGPFCASLDADSEGVEGKFYVWTRAEIEEVLGLDDAAFFARHYDVGAAGNWLDEHHQEPVTILNRLQARPATAEEEHRLALLRRKLLERRGQRVRPGLDDKVLADWNGLTIAALVNAAVTFGEPSWLAMALEAFDVIVAVMLRRIDGESRLGHAFRDGTLTFPGMASDYAAMMRAALARRLALRRMPCTSAISPAASPRSSRRIISTGIRAICAPRRTMRETSCFARSRRPMTPCPMCMRSTRKLC